MKFFHLYIISFSIFFGCGKKPPQNKELPPVYSYKLTAEYSFQLVDKMQMQESDSIFIDTIWISFAAFKDGRISIGDHHDGRVKIFSSDGKFIKSISKKGTACGETGHLFWHCSDENNRIWISDVSSLQRISVYDTNGFIQDTISPPRECRRTDTSMCYLSPGSFRVLGDRIYIAMEEGQVLKENGNPKYMVNQIPFLKIYDFKLNPLTEFYCQYEKMVIQDSVWWLCYYAFAFDSLQNIYFIHDGTQSIQKYSSKGSIVKYFYYPVKYFRPIRGHAPDVNDYMWQQKKFFNASDKWFFSATRTGRMEIFGKYLYISFVNADSEYVDSGRKLEHRRDYMQVFDLEGNCLVDYWPIKGEFLGADQSGTLYFWDCNRPGKMVITKYKFTVTNE